MNMIKVLLSRFQQCLGAFTILLVQATSETGLFRHSSMFCESVTSKMQNLWGSFLVSKILKFNLDFKNAAKNWEKVVCFWDNWIWIGMLKSSLLRTGPFSLVANVLTSSPKIWHVNKGDFLEHNFVASDQWIW